MFNILRGRIVTNIVPKIVMRPRRITRKIIPPIVYVVFLFGISSIVSANDENCNKYESKQYIYNTLRTAIADKLLSELHLCDSFETCLTKDEVRHHALAALDGETKNLESNKVAAWKCGQGKKLVRKLAAYLKYTWEPLTIDSGFSASVAIDTYLRNLFREPGAIVETDRSVMKQLTGSQVLLGYNWVHTDSKLAVGHGSVGLSMRTRLKDWRVPHTTIKLHNIGTIPEGRFLDILLDLTFVKNSSFYDITAATNNIRKPFLRATNSATFSLGLYFVPWKYRFTDYAALGMFAKLQISSYEASSDVNRRIIYGVRLESRSKNPIIARWNIETGLTVNSVPGPFQKRRVIGAERVFVNGGTSYRPIDLVSFYFQFKAEWNVTRGHNLPIYEFRIGAAFDPLKFLK